MDGCVRLVYTAVIIVSEVEPPTLIFPKNKLTSVACIYQLEISMTYQIFLFCDFSLCNHAWGLRFSIWLFERDNITYFQGFYHIWKMSQNIRIKNQKDLTCKDKNKPKSDRWSQKSRKSSRYMQTTAVKEPRDSEVYHHFFIS